MIAETWLLGMVFLAAEGQAPKQAETTLSREEIAQINKLPSVTGRSLWCRRSARSVWTTKGTQSTWGRWRSRTRRS